MIISTLLFWIRFIIFSKVTTLSSKKIFEGLSDAILKTPLSWVTIIFLIN